jgi:hypothetical protein
VTAVRGQREAKGENVAIANPEDRERNRRLGWRVTVSAATTAIVATGLFTFVA